MKPIFVLALCFVGAALSAQTPSTPVEYGEVFVEEQSQRQVPRFSLDVSAALDLDDSFSDLKSYTLNAQARVWKYIGSGVFLQHLFPALSDAGRELQDLEVDGVFDLTIPQPELGIFWHSQIQLLAGEWNFLNLFPMRAEFLVGGGIGALQQRTDVAGGKSQFAVAYLWSAGQRLRLHDRWGLSASIFGHNAGTFAALGLVGTF